MAYNYHKNYCSEIELKKTFEIVIVWNIITKLYEKFVTWLIILSNSFNRLLSILIRSFQAQCEILRFNVESWIYCFIAKRKNTFQK